MEIYPCHDATGRAKTKEVSPVGDVPLPWYGKKSKDKRVSPIGDILLPQHGRNGKDKRFPSRESRHSNVSTTFPFIGSTRTVPSALDNL